LANEAKPSKPIVRRRKVRATPVSTELETVAEVSDEGAGMKMTLPMLKAKAKEMGIKGFSTMKKAQLMDALKGGSKDGTMKELLDDYMKKMSMERPTGPLKIRPATGLEGTVAPKMKSPKESSPKVEVKPKTQTLGLDLPMKSPSAAPKKGKGRRQYQRRAPKTRRLSVKDKEKR
jgi:hypothetical protein